MRQKRNDIDSERIAKLVGVSRSTVSKVINRYPNISQATRDKVLRAIREYQYYPNLSAQILAGKKTSTLGLFFINQGHFSEDVLVNFMISSVLESAAAHGYHVLSYILRDPENPETMHSVKEVFYQRRVDGAIFIGAKNNENLVEELIAEGFVVGIFDHLLPGRNEPNRVVVNFADEETAGAVIDYLVGLGHRRIAVLNGDLRKHAGISKREGFIRGLEKNGVTVPDEHFLYTDFTSLGGYEATRQLLKNTAELPTAVAAVNDNVAFGAIRALGEAGVRVPEDVSVIGIDGHPLCEYSHPPLTTFQFDFHAMMETLITSVSGIIENGSTGESIRREFPSALVERRSCRRL